MPIPLNEIDELTRESVSLRLLQSPARARGHLLYPRVLAHFVDICVVEGLSLYAAKLGTIILLSLKAHEINHSNRARPVFLEAYSYSAAQLLAASITSIGLLYFVALPLLAGSTLGQGLLGLRLRSDDGQPLTVRQLALRILGCAFTYASAGLLCLIGLRQRDGRFLQDRISGTSLVSDTFW